MKIKEIITSTKNNNVFQKKPIKFLIAIFLMKSGLSKFFIIKRKNYKLCFFPTPFSRTLWIEPDYWEDQDEFFISYVKKGDKIIDIGANIGTITLTCSKKTSNEGQVYSIEPNPNTFKFLEKNILLNKVSNVKLFNYAVGDKSGLVDFSIIRSDGQSKIIENEFINDPVVLKGKKIQVPVISIDNLIKDESIFSLIKIDVEGYEKFVIQGAKNIIKNTKCIYFEVVEKNYKKYGYTAKEIYDLLQSYGFQLFLIKERSIVQISVSYKTYATNILAIRDVDDFLSRTGYILKKVN